MDVSMDLLIRWFALSDKIGLFLATLSFRLTMYLACSKEGRGNLCFARHQTEEMKMLNISFCRLEIEPTTCRVYNHTLVPLHHD